ncbi:hypothetical protein B296_00012967 [Ensete ventricosum]|uniref:Uncharacterized protein n=1 Tax=Ensete ventricosum TaxID=4639 RepID=A0A427B261_ENSVE|nr:hypothetical protein B296_00012967 [Ensete ventricosum]
MGAVGRAVEEKALTTVGKNTLRRRRWLGVVAARVRVRVRRGENIDGDRQIEGASARPWKVVPPKHPHDIIALWAVEGRRGGRSGWHRRRWVRCAARGASWKRGGRNLPQPFDPLTMGVGYRYASSVLLSPEDSNGILGLGDTEAQDFHGEAARRDLWRFPDTRSGIYAPISEDCVALLVERESQHLPQGDYVKSLLRGQLDLAIRSDAIEWIQKVGLSCSLLTSFDFSAEDVSSFLR